MSATATADTGTARVATTATSTAAAASTLCINRRDRQGDSHEGKDDYT